MSKVSRIILVVAMLSMTYFVMGCQPAAAATEAAPAAAETVAEAPAAAAPAADVAVKAHYKFAWIMPDMFNPFWVYMRQGAEKAAVEMKAEGIQIDIQQMAPINTFNVEEQVAIFENAITMKVDAIGICVIDQTTVIDQVNKAVAAGIPVAALSTDIPNTKRTIYSGFDNIKQATDVGEYVIEHNEGKGNYIILSGLAGNLISEQRDTGYKAAIANHADTKLLDLQPANFNRAEGMSVMENMLQKYGPGQIQGVFCVNDEVALGAIEAIYAAGREKEIAVGSIDGNMDAAHSIKDGKMLVTSSSDPWYEGYVAVKGLVEFLQTGKTAENPEVKPILYDASNVDELLAKAETYASYYKP
ncbi:MAG: sugar ABC transporter substrate-binding protein [Chloroflexi bacterium]|jgi:ribose transport system substrate-binding protein|nr:sugar ABC transporter substrate-binding protein [Chloroflexota bacterium]